MSAAAVADDDPPFRLRVIPILVTIAMGVGIPYLGAYAAYFAHNLIGTPGPDGPPLPWLYAQHAGQTIIALIAIFALKPFVRANYGLQWPPGKTYIGQALIWGVFFGVLMTVVDYFPQILSGGAPTVDYPLTPANMGGWLFFEGVYVGPTEEIPFRALLVTYLMTTMPGKLRIGNFNMHWAGIIVALIFAGMHFDSFFHRGWELAVGQQIYAFALGVLYAYWLEKSRSIVAPIIGHNIGDVVEYAIMYAWILLAHH